ncbi:MAG: hypothetical protein JWM95_3516 [Gemmatimonadetes bacterium]|nr:hypothetical protein [Gemmatimonadota bacterium]
MVVLGRFASGGDKQVAGGTLAIEVCHKLGISEQKFWS